MNYSSPSSTLYSLTSTTPSSAFPPTPTPTKRSSTLVNVARRNSAKRLSEALNATKIAVVGAPNRVFLRAPSKPYIVPVEHQPVPQSPVRPGQSGPLSRLREHLPRARNTSSETSVASQVQKPSSHWPPQKNECRCLQHVVPGLYLAFENDVLAFGAPSYLPIPVEEELKPEKDQNFTHIVKLTKSQSQPPNVHFTLKGNNVQVLSLSISPHSHEAFDSQIRLLSEADWENLSPETAAQLYDKYAAIQEPAEGTTVLSTKQLLATREFLYASGLDKQERNGPRILITAPRDHRTDVISIVVCYLAYVTRKSVVSLLEQIDRHEPLLGVWRNTVSGDGAYVLQYAADLHL